MWQSWCQKCMIGKLLSGIELVFIISGMAPVHVKIIGELISGRLLVTLSLSQKHLIPEIKLDFFLVAESKFCRLHNLILL